MTKRGQGEGSIGKRRADGLFEARITVEGKRTSKYFAKRADAQVWLNEMVNRKNKGLRVLPDTTLLNVLGEDWLAVKKHSVAGNTYATYETNWRIHIKPELGEMTVKDAVANLQSLINKKAAEVSPATVRKICQVLKGLTDMALERELVYRVPKLTLPKMSERVPVLPVAEQLPFLLEASNSSKYGFGLWLDLGTGIRRSEMLALEWPDFDAETRQISISKKVVRVGTEYIVGTTKTAAGNRIMPLPDVVVKVLQRIAKQKGRMFATESGEYLSPWNWQRLWKAWIKRANKLIEAHNAKLDDPENGIPLIDGFRFHDVRHLYSSNLLLLGIAPRVVQTMTGHSDMTTLQQRYTHVQPGQTRVAADKLNEMLPKSIH